MADCVGCGYCCTKAVCAAGLRVHGPVKQCPSLIWDDENHRHVCRLVQLPNEIGKRYQKELAIGEGCCCSMFNDWRDMIIDRTGREKLQAIKMDKFFKLFLYNLARQWMSKDLIYLTVYGMVRDMNDIGTPPEVVENIVKEMSYIFTENHPSYINNFI